MNGPAPRRTPLFDTHVAANAKMSEFAGWTMPIRYGSQIDEHHAVRDKAGMFDVSHMTVIDLEGDGTAAFLRHLVANDVAKLKTAGSALYGLLLNQAGGIIDDVIVYRRDAGYRIVSNAATRETVIAWYKQHTDRFDTVPVERKDIAMIAVQGPEAVSLFAAATGLSRVVELKRFHALEASPADGSWMIARTGYTGEDGVEVMLPARNAPRLWRELSEAGVIPAGLGARDTLRLEAGLNLYGQDMDETTTPLESNLAWTVAFEPADRDFIGRTALEAQRATGAGNKLTGLALEERGVMRHGMKVVTNAGDGRRSKRYLFPDVGVQYRPRASAADRQRGGRCPHQGAGEARSNRQTALRCEKEEIRRRKVPERDMNDTPEDAKYAETHEWARLDDDGRVVVGISDYAQEQLGDVVYVELPEVDQQVDAGAEAGAVESVKAASDIYAPVSGTVVAINMSLEDAPEMVNQDPYGDGWFFAIEPESTEELADLLDASEYAEFCESDE